MLPIQFFGQNVHFAINVFAALVCFAVFWLYFDAWTARRESKELPKFLGFLVLALSFLLQSTVIEQSVLGRSPLGSVSQTIALTLRVIGYAGIIIGQLFDPLQEEPNVRGLEAADFSASDEEAAGDQAIKTAAKPAAAKSATTKPRKTKKRRASAVGLLGLANPLHWLPPLGVLAIAILYWRRATTGLERHLKPIAIAFFVLFGYEVVSLSSLWQGSSNPFIAHWTAAFGPLWTVAQLLLLSGVVLLGRWVWRYLTERFMSQLFMIFTSVTLGIFLVTTVSFTFLLVDNIQKSALDNLQTSSSVLSYAISGKKAETLADAQSVAANPAVMSAIVAGDHEQLVSLMGSFLHDKQVSSLIITNNVGQVELRAEDPDRYGDSLSSNTLIRRSLIGAPNSSITTKDGVLAPLIYITSSTPIKDASSTIVGTATVGLVADNAFVDGIKHATGLDVAIYAGNVRSATTFVAPDGVSRWIGVKEADTTVQNTVLRRGETFKGPLSVLNRQFLAVYQPLKDVDNTVIGMIFIGQPQIAILQAAGHSVSLTFLITAILMAVTIIPAYLISRHLARQLD